jgi:hypothetical protein
MNVIHIAIISICSLLLITAMTITMYWMNESERKYMNRRRAEWIAQGSVPEDEPNFFCGQGGSGAC